MLKLDRASKRTQELETSLTEDNPFSYWLETNYQTGSRSTYAERDETKIAEYALACGEIVQAIRSSLDHAYWDIVSRVVTNDRERKAIQFPFCTQSTKLEKTVRSRHAHRVSAAFYDAVMALKPHGEEGGNEILYLIDKLNIPDKHRSLTPIIDCKTIDPRILREQVPDFPRGLQGEITIGGSYRDISWSFQSGLGAIGAIIRQRLDIPVEATLPIREFGRAAPMISSLQQMAGVARNAIEQMRHSMI
tara:strand:- start:42 stop:785 length:744 start_codon:yes stop_codon:yes gene_type:complete